MLRQATCEQRAIRFLFGITRAIYFHYGLENFIHQWIDNDTGPMIWLMETKRFLRRSTNRKQLEDDNKGTEPVNYGGRDGRCMTQSETSEGVKRHQILLLSVTRSRSGRREMQITTKMQRVYYLSKCERQSLHCRGSHCTVEGVAALLRESL